VATDCRGSDTEYDFSSNGYVGKFRALPIENRNRALAMATGAPAGTHNVDRLLRLPGTINYPNAAKTLKGRSVCQSSVVTLTDARYRLDNFPEAIGPKPKPPDDHEAGDDKVAETIRTGSAAHYGGDRSRALFAVLCHWVKLGYCRKTIAQMARDIPGDIAAHIAGQAGDPEMTIERQIKRAVDRINFALDPDTLKPVKSIPNIRIAFAKIGVTLRYDEFALQEEIEGLKGFGPSVDDAALNRLWVELDQRFGFRPTFALFATVVGDTAQTNRHHPVKDYLAGLKWDGVPRVDTWLINYGGAKDSLYVRAVSALPLLAAVRRIRQPGCKFDEMLVLEGDQGSGRSSAVRTLAVRDDWFLDSVPFNLDPQKVIERLSGQWILEAAELSGIRKTEIEHYKQFLSSPGDSARPAYGRKKLNAPRQCVFIGTTNDEHYLRDDTGNRRNWGVKLAGEFDIDGLKRDRDQLWAEAAHREAAEESIRLDKSLWPAAEKEQDKRTATDPFDDLLDRALGWLNGQLESASVLVILNIPEAQRNTAMEMRAAKSMKRLGWVKPAQPVWLNGKNRRVWRRGDAPYETITAERPSHTRDLRVEGGRDDRL
jgi:predicted P-loop ATPase